jgi:uncharacterized protein YebE (UPF0316 family)
MPRAEGCQESANLEFLNTYPWILAPAIFFARLLDVTLGTFRTIVVFRGYPALAAFSCGNYLGVWLESKIAIGKELVRIISHRCDGSLAQELGAAGHRVVSLSCEMDDLPADVLLVTSDRRRTARLLAAIRDIDPDAEYTVSDIKSLRNGEAVAPRRWPLVPSGWRTRGKRK